MSRRFRRKVQRPQVSIGNSTNDHNCYVHRPSVASKRIHAENSSRDFALLFVFRSFVVRIARDIDTYTIFVLESQSLRYF